MDYCRECSEFRRPGKPEGGRQGDIWTTDSWLPALMYTPTKKPGVGAGLCSQGRAIDQESTQFTIPLKAVTSTMMPNTIRYQANGTKLLEAI